jgi:hypothetical protein
MGHDRPRSIGATGAMQILLILFLLISATVVPATQPLIQRKLPHADRVNHKAMHSQYKHLHPNYERIPDSNSNNPQHFEDFVSELNDNTTKYGIIPTYAIDEGQAKVLRNYYHSEVAHQSWHSMFEPEEVAFSMITYRPLNMTAYEFARTLTHPTPYTIALVYLDEKDLLNRTQLYAQCPHAHYDGFTACHGGNFSNVLLWKSIYGNETNTSLDVDDINIVSHIIAVRNVLINRDGRVFDVFNHYHRGGCANFGWHSWSFNYTFPYAKVIFYDEPVVVLTQPYFDQYFHEVIEVHSILMTLKPVLDRYPKIKVLVRCPLGRTKMFPLLRLYGIEPTALNIEVIDDEATIVAARYAIMTLMGNCGYFMKNIAKAMSNLMARLPTRFETPKHQILWYDRKYDQTRRITTGDEVMQELIDAFGKQYTVIRFIGNETFEETVQLFSASKFAFGVHGAGMTNMLFMHPNTTIVEVRPENFNINLLEIMGGALDLKYHVFFCGKGRYAGPVPLKPYQFIPYVAPLIKEAGSS